MSATTHPAALTPALARERLSFLALSNEPGDIAYKHELHRYLASQDEVAETCPLKMVSMAKALEGWADYHDAHDNPFMAAEDREVAARYRRCADRAMGSNDNGLIGEAA